MAALSLRYSCSGSSTTKATTILVEALRLAAKPKVRVLSPREGDRFTPSNVWLSLAMLPRIASFSTCFDLFDVPSSTSLGW